MGSCLSSSEKRNPQQHVKENQSQQHMSFNAVQASFLGPDPLGQPEQFTDGAIPPAATDDFPGLSVVPSTSNHLPAGHCTPPGSSAAQVPSDSLQVSGAKAPPSASCLLKTQLGPPESQRSAYSDMVEVELVAEPGAPSLPSDGQLPSATVTPAGNALMYLNKATVLRNRMGAGGMIPPMSAKPLVPAAAGHHGSGGSVPSGAPDRILRSSQLPQHPGASSTSGVESSTVAFGAADVAGDSGLFDGPLSLAHANSSNAAPHCTPSAAATPSAATAAAHGTAGADLAGGVGSASGISGTLGSAVSAAVTSGASGAGSGNFMAPVCGLGVEATLSEMQQMALIGSGGGGCVYIGQWRGVTVAVKFIVSSNDDQLTRSQREALLSRLASHPHVVQTYATSVTQLTESMFRGKDGPPGDAPPGGLAAADANISHDLLAGLTSGSWIRGELQMAMHGSCGGSSCTMTAAHTGGGGGGAALPTILETTPSSLGSVSASMTTSGRGPGTLGGAALPGGSASNNQIIAYESDGQTSSSSTTTRARAATATAAVSGLSSGGQQADALVLSTSANPSNHTSAASSSVGGRPPQHLLHAAAAAAADSAVLSRLAGGLQGPVLSGSAPTSGSVADTTTEAGQVPTYSSGGGSRRNGDIVAAGAAAASSGPVQAAGAAMSAAEAGVMGAGSAAGGGERKTDAGALRAGEARGAAAGDGGVADSFDASFVRDHLGRAKYSIHEVLRQLGAHEGQFLTMVVMEYCDGGSLLEALKEGPFHRDTTSWSPRMWLRSTVRTALEIAHGMQQLHLSGLVHGDLKPGNVLLKGSNHDKRKFVAKVSDLGIAYPVGSADEMAIDDGQIGSIAYMAPEVFSGRIMKASDVYSFGVVLWQLVCGTGAAPFEGAHPVAIALGVSKGKMTLRWPPGVFKPLQQLGEICLQTDPVARPSFKSVVGALEKLERHMQRLAAGAAAGSGQGSTSGASGGGGGGGVGSPVPPNVSPASSLSTLAQQ